MTNSAEVAHGPRRGAEQHQEDRGDRQRAGRGELEHVAPRRPPGRDPAGQRPTPRCSANASTVSATAIRPSRSASPRRAASRSSASAGRGGAPPEAAGCGGRPPPAAPAAAGYAPGARPAAAERELGGVAVHRARVDGHRGVEQVVAELGEALAGHSSRPSSSCSLHGVDPGPAPASSATSSVSVAALALGAREAGDLDERTPAAAGRGAGPRPAGAGRTATASGRPARAARSPAPAPVPGSWATCSDVQRRTPSKRDACPARRAASASRPAPAPAASGLPSASPHLGHLVGVEPVDRLRHARRRGRGRRRRR